MENQIDADGESLSDCEYQYLMYATYGSKTMTCVWFTVFRFVISKTHLTPWVQFKRLDVWLTAVVRRAREGSTSVSVWQQKDEPHSFKWDEPQCPTWDERCVNKQDRAMEAWIRFVWETWGKFVWWS